MAIIYFPFFNVLSLLHVLLILWFYNNILNYHFYMKITNLDNSLTHISLIYKNIDLQNQQFTHILL